jgi:hypothetical protein
MTGQYEFTDLADRKELIEELVALEAKMTETLGYPINLIAYNKASGTVPDSNCRAGLND